MQVGVRAGTILPPTARWVKPPRVERQTQTRWYHRVDCPSPPPL